MVVKPVHEHLMHVSGIPVGEKVGRRLQEATRGSALRASSHKTETAAGVERLLPNSRSEYSMIITSII